VNSRYEVRLAGAGGQGLILAGVTLAEAVATYEGKHVAQTQSYGAEARGGASKAEVIISDGEIDYPKVVEADLLLAMSQEACDRYLRIAEETTGRRITANMVALGLIVGLTDVVSRDAIEAAVAKRAPKGSEELNLRALRAGLGAAKTLARQD
jgi:2-oxoglutarate ferredoxin oxidoreductase subunit gamma